MRRLLTILTLLCLPATQAMARADTTGFIHFSIDNGFPTNNVYSLVQDKNGFLWFATDNGIVKYNGYNFDIYNTDRGLPANDVWELHEDNVGRMWFKCFSYEFGHIRNGKYKRIHYAPKDRILQPYYIVNCGDLIVFFDARGDSYNVCFAGDDLLKQMPFKIGVSYFGEYGHQRNVTASENGGICFWAGNGDLFKLRNSSGYRWEKGCTVKDDLLHLYTSKISQSPDGEMYIFKMYGDRLDLFNIEKCSSDSLFLRDIGADPSERIYALNPYYLRGNKSKNTSLITNSHIYTISPQLKFVSKVRNSDVLPTSSQIAYKYTDRDGHTWYTTNGSGAWSVLGEDSFFGTLGEMPEFQNARFVGAIGNKGYWWDYKKFLLHEVLNNKISKTVELYSNIDIKSITGNDSVAYLSAARTIYRYQNRTGEMTDLKSLYELQSYIFYDKAANSAQENDISMEQVRKVSLIGHNIYGLSSFGLVEYAFEGNSIICRRFDNERYLGLIYDSVNRIRYAHSGQRIQISNMATGEERTLSPGLLDSLGVGSIRQMEMDSFGNIFLLDEKNIFLCDGSFKKLQIVPHRFLVSDAFIQLCGRRLFVAGKFGLAYLSVNGKNTIDKFRTVPNRALGYFKKLENFHVSSNGYAIMKTNHGVSQFHVDSFIRYAHEERRTDFFDLVLLSPFEKKIEVNDTFRFIQETEKMSFDAINFYGSGSVKYTYKIIGKGDWEESTSGEIFLGSLTPGKYYKVVCKIRDDVWESEPHVFYVHRTPYWWQTTVWKTVFWISGILFFLSLVLATVLITRYIVAKKNERKRALVELELRAIHSQINPHFIFNTLSASLFFINKKRFDDAYNHVNKFSKLLRSYLKSSQDRYVMLEEELGMLRNYIDLQQIRFEEKFDYSIEVDNKLPLNNIRIPSLLLQPLVENAINHGLFHKGEGGKLLLKFLQGANSTELICIIDDNGIGREEAKKINETNRTKESYGTKLTNQLLEVFRQYEHFDITIEYTDKELPETGTVVTLILKNIEYVA